MPLSSPSYEELFDKFKTDMEAVGFTHWAEGSRIGAIGKTLAGYLHDLWLTLADLDQQSNPSTARGIYLDRLGEMFGVKRLAPQAASTLGRGPAVQFTNNAATTVTVPANTRLWSLQDPDLAFFTAASLTLGGGAQGFVDVIAGGAGENYNVGAGTLVAHNAGMGQLSVTNVRPIGGGAQFESDASYRYRVSQALTARNGATPAALRQALLAVPGVRDVLIHAGARGNGSVDIVVIPVDRFASADLLAACELAVGDTIAAGISWRVTAPRTRRVDLTIQLRLTGGTTVADVRALVEAAVRAYVDNLRVNDGAGGADLIYNELVSRVQDASPDILDSLLSLSLDGQPTLATNLSPAPGERLVSGAVSIN